MRPMRRHIRVLGDQIRFGLSRAMGGRRRPRILMLADRRGWAFDQCAREISRHLRTEFVFDIRYVHETPRLSPRDYDLVYVFFWGETYHQRFGFDPDGIVKEVSSHRWEDDPAYGPCSPQEMVHRHLRDAGTVVCTSPGLYESIKPCRPRVFRAANGVNPLRFRLERDRNGPLVIGWAGDSRDRIKGVRDILEPACAGHFPLRLATGGLSHSQMNRFYNQLDIYAITSKHEGTPLPLLESMAAGCFPVCTDVGVVREVIDHRRNGWIVRSRTWQDFRAAFDWCETHVDEVRGAGRENADFIRRTRSWAQCISSFRDALSGALRHVSRPRFRNDDVSPDSPLDRFRAFCEVFHRYGHDQLHGIVLRGRTWGQFRCGSEEAQYDGEPPLGQIPNDRIRQLSQGMHFEQREDLIDYLRESSDEIALHGLFHTDYSTMTLAEQRRDMAEGLELLGRLFPRKPVRYFIAPFNRTNADTYRAASEFGLKVLAADGVHLEERLHDLVIQPKTWYRYHHHRFYPESTFRYYRLSVELLDAALARNAGVRPAVEL